MAERVAEHFVRRPELVAELVEDPGVVAPPPEPTGVVVSFEAPIHAVVEGGFVEIGVRLTRSIAVPAQIALKIIDLETNAVDFSVIPQLLQFQAGSDYEVVTVSTSLGSAAADYTKIELRLEADDDVYEGDPEGPFFLETNPDVGPDEATITVVSSTMTGTPNWSFGVNISPPPTVGEEDGRITFPIILSEISASPISIRVQGSSSIGAAYAEPGVDYVALDEVVTIPANDTAGSFTVRPIGNSDFRSVDAVVTITGTLVSGIATSGPITTFDLTIIDDEEPTGPTLPVLEFTATSLSLAAGQAADITAQFRDPVTGELTAFQIAKTVPLALGQVPEVPVISQNWSFIWGGTTSEALHFAGGSSSATIRITAEASLAPGVTLTLGVSPTAEYAVGANSVFSVFSVEAGIDETRLQLAAMTGGGQRIIQGLVAVDPPSLTLPEYALSTGGTVQVVGLDRDAGNKWVSAYVYALHGEQASRPSVSPTVIRPAIAGVDFPPTESGDHLTPTPELVFEITYEGIGTPFQCSTSDPLRTINWTGPSLGRWDQTGPDLVREGVYIMRPIRQGSGGTQDQTTSASEDACGSIEVCVKTVAGDYDVVMLEGRFANSVYREQDDPREVSDWNDGRIHLDYIDLTVPVGWTVYNPYSHSYEGDTAGQTYSLLNRKPTTKPHRFPPARRYGFHVAVIRDTAGSDATDRAEGYLQTKQRFHAVGDLGSTRKNIWGPDGQLTLDYDRLGISSVGSEPETGYDLIDRRGAEMFSGFLFSWQNGSESPEYKTPEPRHGWYYPALRGQGHEGGTSGLYPHSCMLHTWGWYARMRMLHERWMHRHGMAMRDIETDDAAWWWSIARLDGGVWKIPIQGNSSYGQEGLRRHYPFNSPDDISAAQLDNPPGDINTRRTAPTTRTWNTASSPSEVDTDATILDYVNWESMNVTHMLGFRACFTEGWYGNRSFVVMRDWEEVCAGITRVFPPARCSDDYDTADRDRHNLEWIFDQVDTATQNSGEIWFRSNTTPPGPSRRLDSLPQVRGMAVPLAHLAGFYAVTTTELRRSLRGNGQAAGKGGPATQGDAIGGLFRLIEFLMQPNGIPVAEWSTSGSPSPYDPARFGTTNCSSRSGAVPFSPNTCSIGTTAQQLEFSLMYLCIALTTCRRKAFSSLDPLRDRMNRLYDYSKNYVAGSLIRSGDHRDTVAYGALMGFGGPGRVPIGDPTATPPRFPVAATAAQVAAGETWWHQDYLPTGENFWGHTRHAAKRAMADVPATQDLGPTTRFNTFLETYGMNGPEWTDQDRVNYFALKDSPGPLGSLEGKALNAQLTDQSSGRRNIVWDSQQYWILALAYLLNRSS